MFSLISVTPPKKSLHDSIEAATHLQPILQNAEYSVHIEYSLTLTKPGFSILPFKALYLHKMANVMESREAFILGSHCVSQGETS